METLNVTEYDSFFSDYLLADNGSSVFIWDNHTDGRIVISFSRNKHSFFLIGMAFLGGVIAGFFLHCFYTCIMRFILSAEEGEELDSTGGIVNLSFIGDDSRPPVNDHPPDYDSVVSGGTNDDLGTSSLRGLLKRLFGRQASNESDNHEIIDEEAPPSYVSVVANLERELSCREDLPTG